MKFFSPILAGIIVFIWAYDVAPQSSPTAIYWIAADGNDSNAGTESAPWLTWEKAFDNVAPGVLIKAKAGTWAKSACASSDPQPCVVSALPKVSCDASVEANWGTIRANGTAAAPITIEAQLERGVKLKGEGKDYAFALAGCDYWVIHGFLMTGGDAKSSAGGFARDTFLARASSNLTIRRNLVMYNNRHFNTHLIRLTGVTDSLLEENEGYYFHRHGISLNGDSDRITTKRNYLNSRDHADLPPDAGGYDSHDSAPLWGDEGIVYYFSDDGRAYNNIVEKSEGLSSSGSFNVFEGNIAIDGTFGLYVVSNCAHQPADAGPVSQPCNDILDQHPVMNEVRNQVVVGTTFAGIWCKTGGCLIENSSVFDSDFTSFRADDHLITTGYDTRVLIRDSLSVDGALRGFEITTDEEEIDHWRIDNVQAYGHSSTHLPSPDDRATNVYDDDPKIGDCRVYTPANSVARARGIGANIVLTKEGNRMWNAETGAFMWCGAIIPGLNDVAGESCFDVHERLNIGTPKCPVPTLDLQP